MTRLNETPYPHMSAEADISVVIVNWRTPDALRQCVNSVLAQELAPPIEVIVVDNNSQDGSAEMVEREFPGVRLIKNDANRGFAYACNQGMRVAEATRYVLLLNPDTVAPPETIRTMVDVAERRTDAAVVGCRVVNADGNLERTCFRFPSLLNVLLAGLYLNRMFPRHRFFAREFMTWWDRDDEREVDVVTGSFMLVRRAVLDQVGLMDERYFMYVEEADWCYRFAKAGWKRVFSPAAHIVHASSGSSKQVWAKMYVWQRKSVLLFLAKWYGRPTAWLANAIMLLATVPRVIGWAVARPLGLAKQRAAGQLRAVWAATRFHLTGAVPE